MGGKGKKKKKYQDNKEKRGLIIDRTARAPAHAVLADPGVHVFVDDQNLFWGITNDVYGKGYRWISGACY